MQNIPDWLYLWQWLHALLLLGAYAAAATPLIALFTLLVGRRGQARFCFWGAAQVARMGFWLSWLGPLALTGEFIVLVQSLSMGGRTVQIPSVWHAAMLPYTLSGLLWFLAIVALGVLANVMARAPLPPQRQHEADDRYTAAQIRLLLWLGGISTVFFLASFICRSWPFAALPAGMEWDHVAMLVVRQSLHNFFTTFSPAGALLLLLLLRQRGSLAQLAGSTENMARATRWCALWATIGYIPQCLDRLGQSIGYIMRTDLPPGMQEQIWALGFLLLAEVCWAVLLGSRDPLRRTWLIPTALGLLLLSVSTVPLLRLSGLL